MAKCVPHDLEFTSCADCSPRAGNSRARASGPDPGPWFIAAYYGACADCSEDIEPGDEIRADGCGGYLCRECGSDVPEPAWRPPPAAGAAASSVSRPSVAVFMSQPFETGEPWRGPAQADWNESRGY